MALIKLSDSEYFSHPAINHSRLKKMRQSPAAYMANKKIEQTSSMLLGSVVHCLALEGIEEFSKRYFAMPKFDRRTKDGKEAHQSWLDDNQGKVCIDASIFDKANEIASAILSIPDAEQILSFGVAENAVIHRDLETGLELKVKLDYIRPNDQLIVDLKTTVDITPAAFQRSVANYCYHSAAAMYVDVCCMANIEIETFIWIAVSTEQPYEVAIYVADDDLITNGRKLYRKWLNKVVDCKRNKEWPNYLGINELKLPRWAKEQ